MTRFQFLRSLLAPLFLPLGCLRLRAVCPRCGGRGVVTVEVHPYPWRVIENHPCPLCGEVPVGIISLSEPCLRCGKVGGGGVLPTRKPLGYSVHPYPSPELTHGEIPCPMCGLVVPISDEEKLVFYTDLRYPG